jgi:glycosyltransferase involved in cell wall biosynthesis
VRIGIDMLALQSPGSRGRGIGRLSRNLVCKLLERDPQNQYVLYEHEGKSNDLIPNDQRAVTRSLPLDSSRGHQSLFDVVNELARENPDNLDVLLLLSPLETMEDYGPPPKPLNGLKMAAVIYDLIPFRFHDLFLTNLAFAKRLYRNVRTLRSYDLLLAISEATRADFLSYLGMPSKRIVTIDAACDSRFFVPDRSVPMPAAARAELRRLGINRPFVFGLGGIDPHKNVSGLIDAFRILPTPTRQAHQLALVCPSSEEDIERVRQYAQAQNVAEQLVIATSVPDTTLRALYQRCGAFVFPSFHEGFGLPILEAMHCGAAVIAGNNTAQIEVVGNAGLLVNAHDVADISSKLDQVLTDADLARSLQRQALVQAQRYSWEKTADRSIEAMNCLAEIGSPRHRGRPARTQKPRLAVFSPFPPKISGISDYSVDLINHLKHRYQIDLYHDLGYVPHLGLGRQEFGCHDYRVFDRNAAVYHYRGVIYQMGNSIYHRFVYETLLRRRGIVTLHDFCLSAFQWWWSHLHFVPEGTFEREVRHFSPDRADELIAQMPNWPGESGGMQVACARRGLYLNRRIFEHSECVVVHSPWCIDRVGDLFPEHLEHTTFIPLGADAVIVGQEQRAETRRRFGLPPDALICASFGILSSGKMNAESIEAFAPLALSNPNALYLFVGADWEQGDARRTAEALGVAHRVRFLGRQPAADFTDLIAVTDIGINLRRPPTDGETSAALLHMLRLGVPTIVNDVGTFTGYPDDVVCKIRWDSEGVDRLRRAIEHLASNAQMREALGRSAWSYVAQNHGWSRSAARYEEVIERCYFERMVRRNNSGPSDRGTPSRVAETMAPIPLLPLRGQLPSIQ